MPTLPWTTAALPSNDAAETCVVMASRLELRRLRDVPAFMRAAMHVRKQMLHSEGALGVSLIAKPLRRSFWTLSAWRDRAALGVSIGAEPHRGTMQRFRPKMAGSRFVTYELGTSELPPSWYDALRHLESEGVDGSSARRATKDPAA